MPPVRAAIASLVEFYLASRLARYLAAAVCAFLAFGLVVGFAGIDAWVPYRIDFDVYRLGGQVFAQGGDLYGRLPDTQVGANLPFTYPPIAAVLFSVFSFLPLNVGSAVLTVLSVVSMLAVVYLVIREFRPAHRDAFWLTVAVGIPALWVMPMRETVEFGQVNAILMALVAIDLIAGRGSGGRGS